MANYCEFDMKITGRKENVLELVEMLKWQGKYEDDGLGKVYDCWHEEMEMLSDGFATIQVAGNCAWSVLTAMRNYKGRTPSLESETERLGLAVEVFSSEPGMGFQEHCMIIKGEVIYDNCADYFEKETEDGEYIGVGGYGKNYGNFAEIDIKQLKER